MRYIQAIDPLHNMILSTLVAAVPIAFVFWALVIKRLKGYQASGITLLLAFIIAIAVYRMPASMAVMSAVQGALYALFPICWIILSALFLFNLTVAAGRFEVIKHYLAAVTSDRRLQILVIAFSFGSFLEGTAGFATPVVITAAMLYGLGFEPFYAAGICLIANTAPVAFGSVGIPIVVASNISGIPELAISQMVGRTLPFLSFFLPFYMVWITAGWKRSVEIWPACLVSGCSFAFFQWFCSNYLGPSLPDVIAGIASIVCLLVLLRFWKPAKVWRFPNEAAVTGSEAAVGVRGPLMGALAPYLVLTALVIIWGLPAVKKGMDALANINWSVPGLDHRILVAGSNDVLPQVFHLNLLSAAGTAIFLAALTSIPLMGVAWKSAYAIFRSTLRQLRYPVLTVSMVLAFAYLSNNSGITATLATALTHTGVLFPFFAPLLGWLGVFITGSDTSSNALFGKLQRDTALTIGIDPVITVAANCSGGVVGKMISPQSVAIAAAAGGLAGQESLLFRFTVKHSIIMLSVICLLVLAQAYLFKGMVPTTVPIPTITAPH